MWYDHDESTVLFVQQVNVTARRSRRYFLSPRTPTEAIPARMTQCYCAVQ